MEATNLKSNSVDVGVEFQQADAKTKLVVLNYLVRQLNRASRAATPSALFSQRVQEVVNQIQQLPREERCEALQEILAGIPTRLTDAYKGLDTNMRMAFWYRLLNDSRGNTLLPKALPYETDNFQAALLSDLASRESNELVALLREAVSQDAFVSSYRLG